MELIHSNTWPESEMGFPRQQRGHIPARAVPANPAPAPDLSRNSLVRHLPKELVEPCLYDLTLSPKTGES
jgi:hypothetical protein